MILNPADKKITLRPISVLAVGGLEGDLPFLRRVYASTRLDEKAAAGWTDLQFDAFVSHQFEAQHTHYMREWPDADFGIIVANGREDIGRLYLHEGDDEFRIIDISLLPAWRGKKIGSRLLKDILALAQSRGKAVRVHVAVNNPALQLYQRLGFTTVETRGLSFFMEVNPTPLDNPRELAAASAAG